MGEARRETTGRSGSFKRVKFHLKRLLRALGRASGTPHQIALGVAIGFFVAWLPIIGIQMVVSVTLCQILHANRVVPIFPVWLTNPATAVPVFGFNYYVGWLIVGGPPVKNLTKVILKMVTPPGASPDAGYFASWWGELRHAFGELLSMGWEMQLPLWLGCSLVGLALAVPAYFITFRVVDSSRTALARRRQATQDSLRTTRESAALAKRNGVGTAETGRTDA